MEIYILKQLQLTTLFHFMCRAIRSLPQSAQPTSTWSQQWKYQSNLWICSKLKIKTQEERDRCHSGALISCEHISNLFLMFLLLTCWLNLVRKRKLNLAKLAKWFSCVVSTYLYGAFDCMFLPCHLRFQSESTLYSCLNVKEHLDQTRRDMGSLSDCNGTKID